jgi:non-ribosomal peptide synthetase component F
MTVYPLIISVLNAFIYKVTSIKDIVIGANIALRDRIELQKLIGFFVNTILVRNRRKGHERFSDLLTDVIINTSLASAFKYYTMAKLLDDMNIPFQAVNTLFINMLPTQSGVTLTDFSKRHNNNITPGYFDIDLHIQRYVNGIEFVCNYDFSIYSEEDITSLFDEFTTFFRKCINNPDATIDEISL